MSARSPQYRSKYGRTLGSSFSAAATSASTYPGSPPYITSHAANRNCRTCWSWR
ncbi:hypothetical protein [Microbispora triticiradicis]|uniref:hypothetical protein n=1 Tax=Microbispora triticiradicis TaxID=2200763 RepID=UPI001AD7621B|nr:hypothetical protein [Microbispora triticiradicis]MBO4274346.1 hypothetical protein [Microbispora triticiradicis]